MATGVRRMVLHAAAASTSRGVAGLQDAERAIRDPALEWTIIGPDRVDQDVETFPRRPVIDRHLCVPVGDVAQGLVDGADIAAVATRALPTDDHVARCSSSPVLPHGPRAKPQT